MGARARKLLGGREVQVRPEPLRAASAQTLRAYELLVPRRWRIQESLRAISHPQRKSLLNKIS